MENFLSNEIEYWFNIKNGALFTYEYLKGNFDSSPNFASHTVRPRYTHRFTPHFELYEEYQFLTYHFQNNNQGYNDYDDHALNTGFNYQLSPRIALNGFAGYNVLKPARQDTKDGYNLSLGSVITQQHLTFNAAIVKGYDFDYFVLQDSGATKYWGIVTGLFYDVRPNVRWTLWGSYYNRDYLNGLQQTDSSNRKDDLYTVTSSIFYGFSRFASFEFRYTYSADSSNISSNSYMDHKIMGMITFYNTWSNTGEPTETPTPSRPVPFGRRR
jgi:hypothetical protein